MEVDATMAGTLPRTQAGSQQYNPVGLEVGCLFIKRFLLTTILSYSLNSTFSDDSSYNDFTWPGSLPCEQQGEVDQWDCRGDDLRRCCQGDFLTLNLLNPLKSNIYTLEFLNIL